MAQATEGSAVSLEDWVGSALGDQFAAPPADDETDAQPTSETESAPGAPPVEPAPDSDDNQPAPEGDDEETAPEMPAADPTAPDSVVPSATPQDDDPLATAEPFTYTVNGQSRGFEDIKVLPGYGAIIPDTALSKLQTRLSERDQLYETSQQRYKQYQDLERLTEWTVKGPDGKDQTLTGRAGLEAQWLATAGLAAENKVLKLVLQDPSVLRSLIDVDPQSQAIVHNKNVVEYLNTKMALERMTMEQSVRGYFQNQATAQPSQAQTPQVDIPAVAPALVEHTASQLGVTTLTAEDKAFLAGKIHRFIHPATQEDVALSPTPLRVGEPVLDAEFGELVQHQASLRASSAKTVQAASSVSKENAARLAAAQAGKTQVQAHLRNAPQRREAQPINQRAKDADDAFTLMQSLAAGRFPSAGA